MNNETDNALGLRRIQMVENYPIKESRRDLAIGLILIGLGITLCMFGVWVNL